ncbi:hypothetical protein, unlikely [Trypanosoma brucei gambiense DAL972]|uniref:Uncharacterized protein n=1 Tax=Trypanosoma brucei gambiense (strain MHOM/CI/86/DAL972) TaxID=679716 RepID=D0A9G7_TRYB9|nr:hypothetical protein, unlikely [Trypanosoma brucei gambiense DAL972]CBH18318.1 hypothetical protein, unlikely [Trypanosoma brucei gambiense DAL972]|eukprot:XP_011780582.1 hypothetical protein, unlikely [Trypanosoma brucei gambiense DAL972]
MPVRKMKESRKKKKTYTKGVLETRVATLIAPENTDAQLIGNQMAISPFTHTHTHKHNPLPSRWTPAPPLTCDRQLMHRSSSEGANPTWRSPRAPNQHRQ